MFTPYGNTKEPLYMQPEIIPTLPGDKIDDLIETYTRFASADPFGTWLILPTSRFAKTIRKKIIQTGTPILTDHITTIPDLAKILLRKTPVHLLVPEEQHLILRRILSSTKDISAAFPGGNITPDTIENLTSLKKHLDRHISVLRPDDPKTALLSEIFSTYELICTTNDLADEEQSIRLSLSHISEIRVANLLTYGLFHIYPLEKTLLEALTGVAGHAVIYEPFAKNTAIFPDAPGTSDPADPFISGLFVGPVSPPPTTCRSLNIYPDTLTELRYVFESVCLLLEQGTDPDEIVILSPSRATTVELADEIIPDYFVKNPDGTRNSLHYASSGGVSVFGYPVIRSVLNLLAVPLHDFPADEFISLLSYPFFRWGDAYLPPRTLREISADVRIARGRTSWETSGEKRKNKIRRELANPGHTEKTTLYFKKKLAEAEEDQKKLEKLLSILKTSGKTTVSEHSKNLRQLLEDLNYPYHASDEDKQAAEKLLSLLDTLEHASRPVNEKLSAREFSETLTRFLKNISLDLPADPGTYTVRIAGIMEAANTRRKHVFITGLAANQIPRLPLTYPPLTREETQRIRNTSLEETLLLEKYYFFCALLSATESLHLSVAGRSGTRTQVPSPFFTRFGDAERVQVIPGSHALSANQEHAGKYLAADSPEKCRELFGLTPLRDIASRIGIETVARQNACDTPYDGFFSGEDDLREAFSQRYSEEEFGPTALECYAKCPFDWYITHHLGLKDLIDPDKDFTTLGNLIHHILERFVKEYPSLDREKSLAALRQTADEEFTAEGLDTPYWRYLFERYTGSENTPGQFSRFLDMEFSARDEGFSSEEGMLEAKLKTTLDVDGTPVRISGKADRILAKGNTFRVIDYKTGSTPTSADYSNGKSFQLSLYTAAYEQVHPDMKGDGGWYLRLGPKKAGVVDVFRKKDVGEQVDESLRFCLSFIENMKQGNCGLPAKCTGYCMAKYI